MTEKINCRIDYLSQVMKIHVTVHRGWSIGEFKVEMAFVLNILVRRIRCRSREGEYFADDNSNE
jgi:hypothetical protein